MGRISLGTPCPKGILHIGCKAAALLNLLEKSSTPSDDFYTKIEAIPYSLRGECQMSRAKEVLNMLEKTLTVSVALVDKKAAESGEATIIAAGLKPDKYDDLAQSKGFKTKKNDSTLLGYYYANTKGDVLMTYPSHHKVGAKVSV
jgi:hypothetical protein